MSRFIISTVLVLMVSRGITQSVLIPKAVRIGIDLTAVGYTFLADGWDQLEFYGDIEMNEFLLAGTYGLEERKWNQNNYGYSTAGQYFRMGLDYNFSSKNKDRNILFTGIRYARSQYDEEMQWSINDAYWGEFSGIDNNNNVKAGWLELVGGLKARIWKGFFLGFTGRLKFAKKITGEEELLTFEIPGYGRALENSYWGFNYYAFYRIPIGKPSVPVEE